MLNFDPDPIFTAMAVYTNMPLTFVTPSLTAGQNYVITVTADEGSSFDAIVTVKDPNGNIIVNNQDTGTDETINLFPPITGAYSIVVTNFGGTTGAFTVNVYNGDNPQISTDFNLLMFDLEGNYLSSSSLTTNNIATNVPFEFGVTTPKAGETQVQYVIARSSVPTQSPAGRSHSLDYPRQWPLRHRTGGILYRQHAEHQGPRDGEWLQRHRGLQCLPDEHSGILYLARSGDRLLR